MERRNAEREVRFGGKGERKRERIERNCLEERKGGIEMSFGGKRERTE